MSDTLTAEQIIQIYRNQRKAELNKNPNGNKGRCLEIAIKRKHLFEADNIPARIVEGEFKGTKHAWCEYKKDGKWYVDDPGIWYIGKKSGYESSEFKTRGKPDYVPKNIYLDAGVTL